MARVGPEAWLLRLDAWLAPFLAALPRAGQRRWAPLHVQGLLLRGGRKSVEPMAARVAPGQVQQLHHFVSPSTWPHERLERGLAEQADRLVGGPDAVLVVDNTALAKQGQHPVGVQRQCCGQLGQKASCQALVSLTLTLARGEGPVPVALRLVLPERGASDVCRRERAGVPPEVVFRPTWRVALDEIARLRSQGVRFGCVLGDAEYGKVAAFRHALGEAGLPWALGIPPHRKAVPHDVTTAMPTPTRRGGRPRQHPVPSEPSVPVLSLFAGPPDAAFPGKRPPVVFASTPLAGRGEKGGAAAVRPHFPARRRHQPCPNRAAASSLPCSALSPDAPPADTRHPATS